MKLSRNLSPVRPLRDAQSGGATPPTQPAYCAVPSTRCTKSSSSSRIPLGAAAQVSPFPPATAPSGSGVLSSAINGQNQTLPHMQAVVNSLAVNNISLSGASSPQSCRTDGARARFRNSYGESHESSCRSYTPPPHLTTSGAQQGAQAKPLMTVLAMPLVTPNCEASFRTATPLRRAPPPPPGDRRSPRHGGGGGSAADDELWNLQSGLKDSLGTVHINLENLIKRVEALHERNQELWAYQEEALQSLRQGAQEKKNAAQSSDVCAQNSAPLKAEIAAQQKRSASRQKPKTAEMRRLRKILVQQERQEAEVALERTLRHRLLQDRIHLVLGMLRQEWAWKEDPSGQSKRCEDQVLGLEEALLLQKEEELLRQLQDLDVEWEGLDLADARARAHVSDAVATVAVGLASED